MEHGTFTSGAGQRYRLAPIAIVLWTDIGPKKCPVVFLMKMICAQGLALLNTGQKSPALKCRGEGGVVKRFPFPEHALMRGAVLEGKDVRRITKFLVNKSFFPLLIDKVNDVNTSWESKISV